MRLDHVAEQRSERCHAGNFPWWTLWLIWPLMWALSWIGPWLADRGGILLAAIFIIAGLFLLLRPQQEAES
jgi:hypothetical protein